MPLRRSSFNRGVTTIPRNGSGTFTLPDGYLAVTGQTILASQHNPPLEDIATALTGSLPRNGSAGMQADLPMGGFKVTGMADGVNPTDGATVGQASTAAATAITTAPLKTTPVDADTIPLVDSASGNTMKRLTWANLKALFQPVNAVLTALSGIGTAVSGDIIYSSAAGVWARKPKGSDGQILTLAGGLPTWTAPGGGISQSAPVSTSTGATTYDVTGIPSTANRVTVILSGIGFNGGELGFRVGSAASILATGYSGSVAYIANSTNTGTVSNSALFRCFTNGPVDGSLVLNRLGTGNVWVQNLLISTTAVSFVSGGKIDLGANALDRIRLTSVSGTNTGTAGTMVVCWE
jgi:hypothetical protein